ncbi:PAS domain S-box protein [Spirulina sp. CS-785/01]|uniref:PAS domain S-box protein n=1 Tax=Spirulina sp. CS-785/01 TaxID=3021716 RepID=UPI00232C3DC3|nr:PAS domain S-box protein [Spirulina sp. CS-785/01]MDB9313838.1 PAS domain S-box protein [Spirulina sp. CS-785/01]
MTDFPIGHILIGGDCPPSLYSLLTQHQYQVTLAQTPQAVWDWVKFTSGATHPDYIFLSPQVQDMDSYTLCQRLKTHPDSQTLPVLFLSDTLDSLNRQKLFQVGGNGYLLPPFFAEEILTYLKQLQPSPDHNSILQHNYARFNALLQGFPDLLIRMDASGTYRDIVHSGNIALYKPDQVQQGSNLYDILPQPLAEKRMEATRTALASQEIQVYGQEILIDGETHYEEVRVIPCDSQEVLFIVRDITQRKRAELALEASERRNNAILNSIPDLMFRVNRQGGYLGYVRTNTMIDLFPPDFNPIGRHLREFLPEYPEVCQKQLDALQQVLDTGEMVSYEQRLDINSYFQYEEVRVVQSGEDEVLFMVRDISDRKRAELALEASERRNRAILNAIPDLMFRLNRQGFYLSYVHSNAMTELVSPNMNLVGRHISEFLPEYPEVCQKQLNALQQVLDTGEMVSYEQQLQINGSLQYEEVRVVQSGEDEALFMIRDITQRKRAELALEASEQRNNAILNAIPDLMFRVNAQGIYMGYIRTNAMTDLLPSDFNPIGQHLREFLPPDTYQRHINAIQKVLATGEMVLYEQQNEINGKLQYEEVRVVKSSETEVLFMIRDITQRKRDEFELRQQALIFNSMNDGVIVTDLEGKITDWNLGAEKMFGYSKAEVLGQTPEIIHEPHLAKLMTEKVREGLEQQGHWSGEFIFIRKDGTKGISDTSVLPLYDVQGKMIATVGVNHNITERKQAEEQLREQEERLRTLGDNIDKGLIYQMVRAPNGEYYFSYISAGIERLVGLQPEDILEDATRLFNLIIEEDRQLNEQLTEESWRHLTPYQMQMRKRTPSGNLQWSHVRSMPRRLPDGRTVWDGLEVDITELKRTEMQLRESQERFRRAFDDAATGMALVSTEGRLLQVNQSMLEILGYSEAELLNLTFAEITYAEDREGDVALLEQMLAGDLRTYQRLKRYVHQSGRIIWGLLNVSLVRDEQETPLYFVSQIQDITSLKQTQERLQGVAENIPGVIYTMKLLPTGEWRFEYISEECERLFGVSPAAAYEDSSVLIESIHEADKPHYREALQQSIDYLQPFSHEWRQLRPSGEFVWVLGNARPVQRENGEMIWHGVVLDITSLKEAEVQLQQAKEEAEAANRAKSTFLANMSHELRSPLNAILGFAQVLSGSENLNPSQQDNLNIIESSGEHLLGLINDILDLSKIEAGQMTLVPEVFNLPRLLTEVEKMYRLKAQEKDLRFICQVGDDLPISVECDRLKLRQILINLLSNAIKFTPQGEITLESYLLSQNEQEARIGFIVKDTGVGIAPEELQDLFNPFVQTEAGIHSKQGTGLGLAITQRYVEFLGGTITVDSQVGKGTSFQFEIQVIPLETELEEEELVTREVVGLAPDQPEYRLLIVDDQTVNRQLLKQILDPLGFVTKEAENGEEAVTLWESWQPHLIWMDMRMPVMDGYEATQSIRTREKEQQTSPTPILALTASAFDDQRDIALDAGCHDFVSKPFRIPIILDKLEQYLKVRYRYAAEDTQPDEDVGAEEEEGSQVIELSPDWKNAVSEACLALDPFAIEDLLEEMPANQEKLKQQLKGYVNNFAYDKILQILE